MFQAGNTKLLCQFNDLQRTSSDLKGQIAKLLYQTASQRFANVKLLCQFNDLKGEISDLPPQIAKLLCQFGKTAR